MVDDKDFVFLSQWNWHLMNGYPARTLSLGGKKKIHVLLHRQVLGLPDFAITDHSDGNKLNNQKHNLRIADKAENGFNRGKPKNNSTGFKGVYYEPRGKKRYFARLVTHGKKYYSLYFVTPEEAARAYNVLALKFHGRFARINVIPDA